jgi:hypothetical protein
MIASTRAALARFAASPWAVAGVVLAGFAIPLLGSLDRQFYALEADLILAAQLDAGGLREILAGTLKDQSPLYLWILHGWIGIFGDGEMAIRAVSFGFGALAVFYTYLLGRSWRNHWVGLAAAVLLICMPAFTEHARTARMYILYVAFVTGAMAHAARYLRGGSGWELLGVGLLATAGIYNHFLGFGLAALVLTYLVGGSLADPPRRRVIWTGVTAVAVAAVSIPQVLRFSAAWTRAGSKGTFYSVSGSIEEFLRSVNMGQFFSGLRLSDVIPLPAPAPFWIVFGLLLVLALWGVSKLDRRWDQLGALAWFAGGEAALLYLRVARSADVRNRYLSFVIPVVAVLLASALIERYRGAADAAPISRRRRVVTWATAASLVALTVAFCVGTGGQFVTRTRPYGDVMAWIDKQAGENDVVGAYPGWTHNGLRIYAESPIYATANVAQLRKRQPEGRIYFVVSRMAQHNPKRELAWLNENAFAVERKDFFRTRVHVYDFGAMRTARTALAETWARQIAADEGEGFRLVVGGDASFTSWTRPPSPAGLVRLQTTLEGADLSLLTLAPPPTLEDEAPLRAQSVAVALAGRGVDAVGVLPWPGELETEAGVIADLLVDKVPDVLQDGDVLRMEDGGVSLAVMSTALGAPDEGAVTAALERVRSLRQEVDHVVVLASWAPGPGGNATGAARDAGNRLRSAGASAVLGRSGGTDTPLDVNAEGIVAANLGTVLTQRRGKGDEGEAQGRLFYLLLRPDGAIETRTLVVRPDTTGAPVPTTGDTTVIPPVPPRDPVGYRFRDHLSAAELAIEGGPLDGATFEPYVPAATGARRPRNVRRWGDNWWQYVGEVDDVCGGYSRPAIWAHPVREGELVLRYTDVPLGDRIDGFMGVSDRSFSSLESKKKGKKKVRIEATAIEIWIDGNLLTTVTGCREPSWRGFRVDTSAFAGSTHDVTFRVSTERFASHWFSFDAWTVEPKPVVADERVDAGRFDPRLDLADRLDDARVGVRSDSGRYEDCSDPVVGHGYISGEEKGSDGEGRLGHRRRCGHKKDTWNVVATTRQRAGGDLRDCIWAHPVDDAAIEIEYLDVELGHDLSGYLAITDLALDKRDFPVHFEIRAGEDVLYRTTRATDPGWQEFALDTTPWQGQPTDLLVRVETDKQRWRHFCFALGID